MEWIKRSDAESIKDIISTRDLSIPKEVPFVKNLHEAMLLTKKSIRDGMNVTIVGDYDCDGITSSSILKLCIKEYITLLNTKNHLDIIIPDRYKEGYGLNMSIVERIRDGLMITVDNGIAAVEQIKAAKDKGLITIIIDHHLLRDDGLVPEADVVVDPHIEAESEFKDYCGAGLAYRFAMELIPDTKHEAEYIALAGIGTVADVMPLISDNRRLVIEGIKNLANRNVPVGLDYLLSAIGTDEYINEEDIGFSIGPCFNALGRMYGDGGKKMVDLITAENPTTDYEKQNLSQEAYDVVHVNEQRQALVLQEMNLVNESLLRDTTPAIILEDSTIFTKGTVGIIAGKLTEKYRCPAFVFTQDTKNADNLSGSGRSPEDIHLKKLLDKVAEKDKDIFVGYGGHAGAAGLTIRKTSLDAFEKLVKEELEGYEPKAEDVYYDLECAAAEIPDMLDELSRYAPYGEGNPQITFRINNVSGIPKIIGKFKNHFRIQGPDVTLLGFDLVEKWMNEGEPTTVDVVGTLGVNHFKDKDYYQIRLIDFKKHEIEKSEKYNELASLFTF